MKTDTGSLAFLILLVVLSALGPLSLNIILPSLPGIPAALSTTKENAQLILSLYLFGMALGQLIIGPLADRFGRRPVLVGALVVYALSSIAATFASDIGILVVARLMQSFGATAGIALTRTMIRDLYDLTKAARLISYVTTAMVLAPMFSPFIGAQIDENFGWRAIFGFCSLIGAMMLALAWQSLPETRPKTLVSANSAEVARRTIRLVGNGHYMAYWGTAAFCSAQFFGFLGAAPYLMIEVMGHSKTVYGLWFMTLSVGYMAGNFFSGKFGARIGVGTMIFWGNIAGLIGALMLLAPALFGHLNPGVLFIPAMVMSFGNGLVLPNALSGGIGTDPEAAGAGSGLMGFGQVGVGAVVSYISGKVSQGSAMPIAIMMTLCAIASLYFGLLAMRHLRRQRAA